MLYAESVDTIFASGDNTMFIKNGSLFTVGRNDVINMNLKNKVWAIVYWGFRE
jgi:hypothetical protein